MAAFAITVFLGALLIFQVQPILGRYILPWFGGGPGVWTTCLLFFQLLLLGGYAYAHWLATALRPAKQRIVHLSLLGVSLLALPIAPNPDIWKRAIEGDPTWHILALLAVSAGLPYLTLSATAPLVQRWFHDLYPSRTAYRLYAVSNAGSLLALISYPSVVEPLLRLDQQSLTWSLFYALFALCCAYCAWQLRKAPAAALPEEPAEPQTASKKLTWLTLSAIGSVLLVATTNQMSQEIAVVPFLWILPLTIYLLTFILCFESENWYGRKAFSFLLAIAVPAAAVAMAAGGLLPIVLQIAIYCGALFIACMVCHGELYITRPHAAEATSFYLWVAAGGALGGIFVAVIAPRIFSDYWEYAISLCWCAIAAIVIWIASGWRPETTRPTAFMAPPPALFLSVLIVVYAVSSSRDPRTTMTMRNFYGVLRVSEEGQGRDRIRILTHGRTEHGTQYLEPERSLEPTTYFGSASGIELAFDLHPRRLDGQPLYVAVVGLGAGTMAAYGREGDTFRFYEINPQVIRVAGADFTYLNDSDADIELIAGDARVRLEEEIASGEVTRFDVLAIDAFTSGAIPLHLLTAEAADVYRKRLKDNGILAFHITNRFLDLTPVVNGMADRLGLKAIRISTPGSEPGANAAVWMLLTKNEAFLAEPRVQRAIDVSSDPSTLRWTDDYAGLWQALN
jgi:spermidine synthase